MRQTKLYRINSCRKTGQIERKQELEKMRVFIVYEVMFVDIYHSVLAAEPNAVHSFTSTMMSSKI